MSDAAVNLILKLSHFTLLAKVSGHYGHDNWKTKHATIDRQGHTMTGLGTWFLRL